MAGRVPRLDPRQSSRKPFRWPKEGNGDILIPIVLSMRSATFNGKTTPTPDCREGSRSHCRWESLVPRWACPRCKWHGRLSHIRWSDEAVRSRRTDNGGLPDNPWPQTGLRSCYQGHASTAWQRHTRQCKRPKGPCCGAGAVRRGYCGGVVRRRSQITNQLHKAWSTLLMPNKNLARLSIKRLGPPPVPASPPTWPLKGYTGSGEVGRALRGDLLGRRPIALQSDMLRRLAAQHFHAHDMAELVGEYATCQESHELGLWLLGYQPQLNVATQLLRHYRIEKPLAKDRAGLSS